MGGVWKQSRTLLKNQLVQCQLMANINHEMFRNRVQPKDQGFETALRL